MKTKFSSVAGWALAIIVAVAVLSSFGTFVRETEKIKEVEKKSRVQSATVQRAIADRNRELCQDNLKLIAGAKATWGIYNHYGNLNEVLTMDALLPGEQQRKLLVPKFLDDEVFCPGRGTYTVGALTNAPTCTVPGHILQ